MKLMGLAFLTACVCTVFSASRGDAQEFSAGFNDAVGINSNATIDSPYALDQTVFGQGLGEAGWDGGWLGVNGPDDERLVQGDVVFEGDGALELFGFPTSAERLFAEPQTGIMTVSLRILVTQMLGENQGDRDFIFRLQSDAPPTDSIACQWAMMPDRSFLLVVDDDENIRTNLTWTPGVWHRVDVWADFQNKIWMFAVDGVIFENGGEPLSFRGNPSALEKIHLLSELSHEGTSVFIDDIRINGAFPSEQTEIAIDVVPGKPNRIKYQPKGKLEVAVLSSADFDARDLDPASIRFGDEELVDAFGQPHVRFRVKDINKDRRLDLVLEFDMKQLVDAGALTFETTSLALTAQTVDGDSVFGLDRVDFTRK